MPTVLLDKLRKMIAHEQSARSIGSIAEAEAFAAKIQELLAQNKLSMSAVEVDAELRDEPVGEERVPRIKWMVPLAIGVAASTFCHTLSSGDSLLIIGSTSNRQACTAMLTYLLDLGESLSQTAVRQWKRTEEYRVQAASSPRIARTWRNSYLHGYATALYRRLQAENKQLASGELGLVYMGPHRAAIDSFVRLRYPNTVKRKSSSIHVHTGAYQQGYTQGSSVSASSRAALSRG